MICSDIPSVLISGISLPTGALVQLPEPLLGHTLSAGSSCPINPWIETAETVQSIEHGKGTKSPSKPSPLGFNMIIIWLLYYIYMCVCELRRCLPTTIGRECAICQPIKFGSLFGRVANFWLSDGSGKDAYFLRVAVLQELVHSNLCNSEWSEKLHRASKATAQL